MKSSPFHAGERALQESLDVADRMAEIGRKVIRDHMPDQHRQFFAQLPMLVTGHLDAQGHAWASIVGGPSGFISSPTDNSLVLDSNIPPGDPLSNSLAPGLEVGLLGLEFPTRRRNRANGQVHSICANGITIEIRESFGNCPKYIEPWHWEEQALYHHPAAPLIGFDAKACRLIDRATCFFVATAGPGTSDHLTVDVSHRGGPPGFVTRHEDTLLIPDYSGNRFFNTLGNIMTYPQTGLTFPDFRTGDVLQMTGTARIMPADGRESPATGVERVWQFKPETKHWLRGALPVRRVD
ncbi:pyridoxamine 5'-phosphate oxidase family protein [Aestuariispira insulae]|uniref:Uncharacterized protein n=1 Tax=Aestuariispira insulae TaxID=1461337 RepID=A0A3D9HWU6_9PROT|nr:pyridoxamine 5'-phosphate oxidase family protein [Aestuariispira insulae]RED53978.1 hypothetical protein DFP90_101777 [Aestuariispira insulae]